MSLLDQLSTDLTSALRQSDQAKKDVIRSIISQVRLTEKERGSAPADLDVVSVIQREVKRRHEAIAMYKQANRQDAIDQETLELTILQSYLPEQMSQEDIRIVIEEYLDSNPTDPNGMGQAMGALSAKLKGKADMAMVSQILKELMSA
jgi:uncharacterized protein YqeY